MCDECSTGCKNLTFIINKFESLGESFIIMYFINDSI